MLKQKKIKHKKKMIDFKCSLVLTFSLYLETPYLTFYYKLFIKSTIDKK